MDFSNLGEDIRRITLLVEIYTQLSEQEHSDRRSMLLAELRCDLRKLSAEILKLPSEPDRNGLWKQIIEALQNAGMIATAVKAVVESFSS